MLADELDYVIGVDARNGRGSPTRVSRRRRSSFSTRVSRPDRAVLRERAGRVRSPGRRRSFTTSTDRYSIASWLTANTKRPRDGVSQVGDRRARLDERALA
jgi:hypothetical protein